jgi:phage gp46-like protein
MAFAGAGTQPAGSTSAGFGTSAEATTFGTVFLRDTLTSQPLGTRKIDPVTRDFVLDDDGRILGQDFVRHAVQMSLHTVRGSAADGDVGQRLHTLDRITPNFERQVEAILTEAVQPLIIRGLIEVVGFRNYRTGDGRNGIARGAIYGRFLWRDLTTGLDHEEVI